MEPPQICYTLICVMVGCCSVIAGGLAEGCNINWSRMKVDPVPANQNYRYLVITRFEVIWKLDAAVPTRVRVVHTHILIHVCMSCVHVTVQ